MAKTATVDDIVGSLSGQPLLLGGQELTSPSSVSKRFSLMLWGDSGCGKTTLAATAPGKLLWLNFDPDGTDSLASFDQDNIKVLDMAQQPASFVEQFKNENVLGLDKFLAQHPEFKTVVFDSLTTFGDKALVHGVYKAGQTKKGATSTLENPGRDGYGHKNTYVRLAVKNLLYITKKHDRNIIFIAHEAVPEKNEEGVVLMISIMLGSNLVKQVPVDLSEIWAMEDTGKKRRIAVRACRFRRPMKTRMFISSKGPEFEWDFNSDTQEGEGIEDWYNEWMENGRRKIALPTS